MAKRKTPKAKNLKPTSITQEELQFVQAIISPINQAQTELGRLETRKHSILHEIISLNDKLQEKNNELREKYGNVNINIQDGTIDYPENE
jgi:beta-galactosidase beta subunit|tara:strand:+ start:261 stop:530 length:270 start_codon:yes stop_codon:yes gene_type:complete